MKKLIAIFLCMLFVMSAGAEAIYIPAGSVQSRNGSFCTAAGEPISIAALGSAVGAFMHDWTARNYGDALTLSLEKAEDLSLDGVASYELLIDSALMAADADNHSGVMMLVFGEGAANKIAVSADCTTNSHITSFMYLASHIVSWLAPELGTPEKALTGFCTDLYNKAADYGRSGYQVGDFAIGLLAFNTGSSTYLMLSVEPV